MSLETLKLDRFLQRNTNNSTTSPFQGIDAGVPDGQSYESQGGSGGQGLSGDTGGITGQPGGIIAQMFLRSSNSQDRVEINPNDSFIAYNNDNPVVIIDSNGISLGGAGLPQTFSGAVTSLGVSIYLPSGWSSVRNALGDYTITHNMDVSTGYSVVLTPITGHFRGKLVSTGPTSFNITFQESVYDMSGLYTGETLVDTDFNFIVVNVL